MITTAIINAQILLDNGFEKGRAVVLDGEQIAAVPLAAELPADMPRTDLQGAMLVPGFVDVQVNGGGGALFNDAPTVKTIATIGAAHRRFGTTGFLPTLISDDLSVVREAVQAVDAAIQEGVPGVLGIHVEGPYLNARRKGIHDSSKLRILDDEGFEVLTSLKRGCTVITLAPERTTPEMIRRLAEAGVVVSAGHTNGTYADIRAALDQGLSGFTHLFNAMSPLTSREPGAVGAALDDQGSWCGLIVDGRHIDPVTMRLALRCKPLDRFMLVTDGMPSVGMVDKNFMIQGQRIRVEDGACINADGTLAGSDLDMALAVRNAVNMLQISPEQALRMASTQPAQFLRLGGKLGKIGPGVRADLVALDADLQVLDTWIGGASA